MAPLCGGRPRQAPGGEAQGKPEAKGELMHWEVHDFFTEFMSTLDLVLEAFLKEWWRSLEERYLSHVTLVVSRGTIEMRSMLRREAVAGQVHQDALTFVAVEEAAQQHLQVGQGIHFGQVHESDLDRRRIRVVC